MAAWAILALCALARAQTAEPLLPDEYSVPTVARPDTPWWTALGDPALTAFLDEALAANPDLEVALARADVAQAQAVQAGAALWPTLSLDGNANMGPTESLGFQFGGVPGGVDPEVPKAYLTGSALFTASWGLDVFGRQHQLHRAAQLRALAAEGDARAQRHALTALLARTWYDVAAAQRQVALAEEQIDANQRLLEAMELRFRTGLATGVELVQQRQQLAAAEARLPAAQRQLRILRHQLATLAGLPPTEALEVSPELPRLPTELAIGRPGELATESPEVLAAQARLEAAEAMRRATVRQMLPDLGVTAQAGWQAFVLTEPKTQSVWATGLTARVPLFAAGANVAALRGARAEQDAAAAALRSALLTAHRDVEDALAAVETSRAQLLARSAERAAAADAYQLARERFVAGLADYLTVLTALQAWQSATLGEVDAERLLIEDWIGLQEAAAIAAAGDSR